MDIAGKLRRAARALSRFLAWASQPGNSLMQGLHHWSTAPPLYKPSCATYQNPFPRTEIQVFGTFVLLFARLTAFYTEKLHHGKPPTTRPHHGRQPRHRSRNRTIILKECIPLHSDLALGEGSKNSRSKPNSTPIYLTTGSSSIFIFKYRDIRGSIRNARANTLVPTRIHRRQHIPWPALLGNEPFVPFCCPFAPARAGKDCVF
jgi:hypothetical protein